MSDAEKGFDISPELVGEFVFDVDFGLPGVPGLRLDEVESPGASEVV